MDIETLTKVADVLADVTGLAGDVEGEEWGEAQGAISKILTGLADKLGDEDGPAFLRMYGRACEREDANPLGPQRESGHVQYRACLDCDATEWCSCT
jgi:hypothetical protein